MVLQEIIVYTKHTSTQNHTGMAIWATAKNYPLILRKLLTYNHIDPDTKNPTGTPLLHLAATIGNTEVARLLLEFGADHTVLYKNRSLAETAIARGNPGILELLLPLDPDLAELNIITLTKKAQARERKRSIRDLPPLHYCADKKFTALATRLLADPRIDINETHKNKSALFYAVARNFPDVVHLLLEHGAKIEYCKPDQSIFFVLYTKMHRSGAAVAEILEMLLKHESASNFGDERHNKVISQAMEVGAPVEQIKRLIAAGFPTAKASGYRRSVAEIALMSGKPAEYLKVCSEFPGIDLLNSSRDDSTFFVLPTTSLRIFTDSFAILKAYAIKHQQKQYAPIIKSQPFHQKFVYHILKSMWKSKANPTAILQFLIENDYIDCLAIQPQKDGKNPFHIFAVQRFGHEADLEHVLQFLVKHFPQMDINQFDDDGATPLMLALEKQQFYLACIQAMMESGADVTKHKDGTASIFVRAFTKYVSQRYLRSYNLSLMFHKLKGVLFLVLQQYGDERGLEVIVTILKQTDARGKSAWQHFNEKRYLRPSFLRLLDLMQLQADPAHWLRLLRSGSEYRI